MRVGVGLPGTVPELGGAHFLTEALAGAVLSSGSGGPAVDFVLLTESTVFSETQRGSMARMSVESVPFTRQGQVSRYMLAAGRSFLRIGRRGRLGFGDSNALANVIDRRLRELEIDLVWFPGPAPCALETPYVTTVYNLAHIDMPWFPEFSSDYEWQERERYYREVLGRATHVIASTEYTRDKITAHYPVAPSNVTVLPYPVPPDVPYASHHAMQGSTSAPDQPTYLYPAQFWPHKAHAVLIDAMGVLRDRGVPGRLVLTGSDKGNADFIKDLVQAAGLQGQVEVRGFVDRSELLTLYQEATALVAPTRIGPDGIPFLEAMAVGCPIVAGSSMGTRDWIDDCGRVVDGVAAQDWADAIESVTADPYTTELMRQKAHSRALGLTPNRYFDGLLQVVYAFLQQRRLWPNSVSTLD